MEKLKELVLAGIDYLKANPVYAIILAAALVFLIVILVVIISLSSKKRKAKKRIAAEAAAKAKAQAEQKAAEAKAAEEKKKAEEAEAKRQATLAKLEADRLAAEQAEAERKAAEERAEAERKAAEERAEAERKAAAERAVAQRIAAEKAEAERVAAEKAAAAKAEAEKAEKARARAEKVAAKKAAAAKAAAEKAEAERIAAEKAAAETAIAAKVAAEKAAASSTTEQTAETPNVDSNENEEVNKVLYDQMKDAVEEDDIWYDENETDKAARYSGKWQICRVLTDDNAEDEMYFFELHASNGEKLLSSEEYTSYNGALRGIETHKTNILKGNFKITLSKKGDYIFKLLSGKNMLLCMGENYPTKARCESAIESAKRFAKTAVIDENVQDIVVKVPAEDDTPITPLPEGITGKWLIDATTAPDGEKFYFFELLANNGEKLLSSEEYTSYVGAINGIQTHKRNIEDCNFRITLTKRGDYIYKLLNGNGQLLCLGEHYKTKRLCQNAVDSVKRFAANSPILTDPKLTK